MRDSTSREEARRQLAPAAAAATSKSSLDEAVAPVVDQEVAS